EIGTEVPQASRLDPDPELGADAIGGGDEDRVGVARGAEVEEGAEAAEAGDSSGTGCRGGGGPDLLDERVAGVDVDAGGGIGEALVRSGHARIPCGRSLSRMPLSHHAAQGNGA